jgi:hypothetical protein
MGKTKTDKDTEVRELRKENADLRRTVARLRKSLERFENLAEAEEAEETPKTTPVPPAWKDTKCPKCGSMDQRLFGTPTAKILICAGCKNRRIVVV